MLSTTNAIVLSKLKYRDNDLIVKCYTQEHGVISFLIRGVLKSKKNNTKTAYFQLLSQLQIVFNYTKTRSLYTIKEVRTNFVYGSLHSHILKSSVVMFLSEILSTTLQEEEQNEALYSYLETTLLWFDADSEYSNFHLLFLLNLTKYLGFYPDTTNIKMAFFNLEYGNFQDKLTGKHNISGENLILLKNLLGIKFDALYSIKINAAKRQSFLNMILLYFELHLGSFRTPKSLQIFNQVFN
ncbi:DNA repair protein RecO [Hyunsoonleella pacifica]|uniref:DNA repair protein RecO n=1 Tax=Hyunsoonleella pacifica TaxID=1080224 RepID=A0A4Q9FPF7_9FLAO|nr:DNA repair protein RecO [Hyunsoonleella pacifica]TBN16538.1 DNA repair protein RecO [Hyunsoonleella pacifica]GGD18585.1 DNA repair protein RecO [Hyunsoonleella pacifica]